MSESNRNEWTEQEKQEWRERGGIGVPPWESKWRDFKPLAQRWLEEVDPFGPVGDNDTCYGIIDLVMRKRFF